MEAVRPEPGRQVSRSIEFETTPSQELSGRCLAPSTESLRKGGVQRFNTRVSAMAERFRHRYSGGRGRIIRFL